MSLLISESPVRNPVNTGFYCDRQENYTATTLDSVHNSLIRAKYSIK